jgi:polysaccharide biosynthesis protein PslH
MKLLFLSHDIPSPALSDTLSLYHLIRHLSTSYGHDITLVSFVSERSRPEDSEYLKSVCTVANPIQIQWSSPKKLAAKAIKNSILNLPKNLRNGLLVNELDYYCDRHMDQMIKKVLEKNSFELLFSTRQMANYVVDVDIPKIVQPFDALSEWHRQVSSNSRGVKRTAYGIRHILNRTYEKHIYDKFDACLVVTERDKELLESLNPQIRCKVVPIAVDVDYFSHIGMNEEPSSLVLLAGMRGPVAVANVLHFYNEIFPLILRERPDVMLYLVGRDPAQEVVHLSSDPLVSVTGYVDDVRPYIAKSTIFISPEILGTGMKYKVLEAMSMSKAVVTTSLGAQGIPVKSGEHLQVADTPKEFAKATVSLLNDQRLRATIGANARKLVEEQYSWEAVTKVLNELFVNVLPKRE